VKNPLWLCFSEMTVTPSIAQNEPTVLPGVAVGPAPSWPLRVQAATAAMLAHHSRKCRTCSCRPTLSGTLSAILLQGSSRSTPSTPSTLLLSSEPAPPSPTAGIASRREGVHFYVPNLAMHSVCPNAFLHLPCTVGVSLTTSDFGLCL
jgi:hypothetical protein